MPRNKEDWPDEFQSYEEGQPILEEVLDEYLAKGYMSPAELRAEVKSFEATISADKDDIEDAIARYERKKNGAKGLLSIVPRQ